MTYRVVADSQGVGQGAHWRRTASGCRGQGGFLEMGSLKRQRGFPCLSSLALSFHLSSVHHPPSSYRRLLSAYCVRRTAVSKTWLRQTATHVINNNQTQKFRYLCVLPRCLGLCFLLLSSIPPLVFHGLVSVAFQYLLKAGILGCCWPER